MGHMSQPTHTNLNLYAECNKAEVRYIEHEQSYSTFNVQSSGPMLGAQPLQPEMASHSQPFYSATPSLPRQVGSKDFSMIFENLLFCFTEII